MMSKPQEETKNGKNNKFETCKNDDKPEHPGDFGNGIVSVAPLRSIPGRRQRAAERLSGSFIRGAACCR
jgi:hypothetical protein